MGLGLLGRGVGDIAFLADHGADLIVTDLKTETELKDSLYKLQGYENIKYRLGGHDLEDFSDRDLIIRAPNVPIDSEFLKEAKKNDIPITQSAVLFAKLTKGKLIGVTGTRGKSTVTQIIYEILKNSGERVFLGGNVRGVSTLALLPEVQEDDYVVLELDSWQLQSFGDEKISPKVAVFTAFMSDHMNYYKGDIERYLDDKANIFRYQTPEDLLVVGNQVNEIVEKKYSKDILADKYVASESNIPHDWKLKIPGIHNRYNAGIAKVVAENLNISDEIIRKTITEFKGLPFRLELVIDKDGVYVYNDSNSTSPEATIAAINSFPDKNIILIAGGTDKNLETKKMAEAIKKNTKKLILLSGSGTDKLKKYLDEGSYLERDTIEDCVDESFSLAKPGDVIVFSPGFSSFEKFKNEYDRGEKFNKALN